MTESRSHPPHADDPGDTFHSDPSLEALRDILFGHYRRHIAELEAELEDLERRVTDEDALVAIITPVIGDAIRRKIRDAREEMVEALYPVIGQTVVRAVSEAIRDLARTIDAQMRTSLGPRAIWQRLRARVRGVSGAEMALRESLPFEVAEVFLIHRETGLLLSHVSRDHGESPDSDLIGGMMTAIRDFARDAFGRGQEGQLDEIQYGERRILIEAARHAYLAVVIDGIEPPGFRTEMRERVIEVNHVHEKTLRHYEGDPASLAPVEVSLRSLITTAEPRELSPAQKRLLAGAFGLVLVCLAAVCLAGGWAWRTVRSMPTPLPVAVGPTLVPTVIPSSTPTATPSPTATSLPTATPSPAPTATPLPTLTPMPASTATPAPTMGLMTGNVWLHGGPSADSPRLGIILERGQSVEILAVFGDWYRIRWAPQGGAEVIGWVSAEWVGTTTPIPAWIITPTPGS
jgi:hypothetical protein